MDYYNLQNSYHTSFADHYINIPVTDRVIMKQNQEFQLKVKVNDIELTDVEFIVGDSNHIGRKSNGNFYVLNNAPISTSNLCKISVIDSIGNSLRSISLIIIPEFTISLETYSTTAAANNQIQWKFTSTSNKYNIAFTLELLYNDGTTRSVYISGSGTGRVDIPTNNSPNANFAVAQTKITNLTFTQYWSSQSTEEQYSVKFYNSFYTGASNNTEYPFYMEPVKIDMLFAGGSGTLEDPYQIKNSVQLRNMQYMLESGSDEYDSETWIVGNYVLMNNITTSLTTLPTLRGRLKGYNATNYTITISSLTNNGNYAGLFSKIILGSVENITVNITGDNSSSSTKYKGAISGYLSRGTISNCTATGNFTKYSNNVMTSKIGGVVGYMSSGVIANCESKVNINTYGDAGGIVGVQYGGNIRECSYSGTIQLYYELGSVKSDSDNVAVGGIVGRIYAGSIVTNELNNMKIIYMGKECNETPLKPCIGFFVGRNMNGLGTVAGDVDKINGTIDYGELQDHKGFLGIGKYNQREYVATNKAFWGRGD